MAPGGGPSPGPVPKKPWSSQPCMGGSSRRVKSSGKTHIGFEEREHFLRCTLLLKSIYGFVVAVVGFCVLVSFSIFSYTRRITCLSGVLHVRPQEKK